jgi:hypothetical protein
MHFTDLCLYRQYDLKGVRSLNGIMYTGEYTLVNTDFEDIPLFLSITQERILTFETNVSERFKVVWDNALNIVLHNAGQIIANSDCFG